MDQKYSENKFPESSKMQNLHLPLPCKGNYLHSIYIVFTIICCCCSVAQSCLTLCDPMDCSLPGFSVHGISQARILEWVAIFLSIGSSWPRDWAGGFFYHWATKGVQLILSFLVSWPLGLFKPVSCPFPDVLEYRFDCCYTQDLICTMEHRKSHNITRMKGNRGRGGHTLSP